MLWIHSQKYTQRKPNKLSFSIRAIFPCHWIVKYVVNGFFYDHLVTINIYLSILLSMCLAFVPSFLCILYLSLTQKKKTKCFVVDRLLAYFGFFHFDANKKKKMKEEKRKNGMNWLRSSKAKLITVSAKLTETSKQKFNYEFFFFHFILLAFAQTNWAWFFRCYISHIHQNIHITYIINIVCLCLRLWHIVSFNDLNLDCVIIMFIWLLYIWCNRIAQHFISRKNSNFLPVFQPNREQHDSYSIKYAENVTRFK